MAVLESTQSVSSKFDSVAYLVERTLSRLSSWLWQQRRYRAIKSGLQKYSRYELAEMGIRTRDIPSIADALTRGLPTRCEVVNLKNKLVLRGIEERMKR